MKSCGAKVRRSYPVSDTSFQIRAQFSFLFFSFFLHKQIKKSKNPVTSGSSADKMPVGTRFQVWSSRPPDAPVHAVSVHCIAVRGVWSSSSPGLHLLDLSSSPLPCLSLSLFYQHLDLPRSSPSQIYQKKKKTLYKA